MQKRHIPFLGHYVRFGRTAFEVAYFPGQAILTRQNEFSVYSVCRQGKYAIYARIKVEEVLKSCLCL